MDPIDFRDPHDRGRRPPRPTHASGPAAGATNTWAKICGLIEGRISELSFRSWFKPCELIHEDASRLIVRVPNEWYAEWFETNYFGAIERAKAELGVADLVIEFRSALVAVPAPPESARTARPARFNPRFTFSNFVVSNCNQFAHAAALAVAEEPNRIYNPLYLYGDVGLGKTHLMQAIGSLVGRRDGVRMEYVTAEHFMNELINAIRYDKTLDFKRRYRTVDLLLIDDVQFLANKERTQEELFHTFNALYDSQRQIVLTSDIPPRDIPGLEDRLRSRFEWGLLADIQPPDLETKIAILRKKAEADAIVLADDVALFIASHCGSNVRELEGSLIRLTAYGSIHKRPIDLELAHEVLKDLLPRSSPAATSDSIQKLVAEHFKLRVNELKSKTNSRRVAFPRQIAMYLCKQLTDTSLQEIGRRFGGKHHSTVIHAIQRIEARREQDAEFNSLLDQITQALK